MPFTAETEEGDTLNILDYEKPKTEIDANDLFCPGCEEELFIRSPTDKLDHFCHYPDGEGGSDCGRAESLKHLLGKRKIRTFMESTYPKADVKLEETVGDRRADILVHHYGGQNVAHELQLSKITQESVSERSVDYLEQGVSVQWWFGPKVSGKVRSWTIERLGGYYDLEIVYETGRAHAGGDGVPSGQGPSI